MSEYLKNNQKDKTHREPKRIDWRLFERDEKELPRFNEYRHLMRISRELNLAI